MVEKQPLVPVSYERLDDEKVKVVLAHNEYNNNYYNVVSDSECEDEEEKKPF